MKKYLLLTSAFALFAGTAMAENVINEGGWDKEIYGTADSDTANVSTRVVDGTFSQSQIYGGQKQGSSIGGNSVLKIENGTFGNGWNGMHMWLYGGSAADSTIGGNSSVEISGGTFAAGYGYIYGGSNGGTVNGDSGVYITGGSFAHYDIYGGGAENSVVNGNSRIEISNGISIASDKQVAERFGGQIFLGGNDNSVVKGNASIFYDAQSTTTTLYLSGRNNSIIEGTVSAEIGKNATFFGIGACGEIRGNNVKLNADGSVASVKDASKTVISLNVNGATLDTCLSTSGDNWSTENTIYGSSTITATDSTIIKMRGAFGEKTVLHGNSNIVLNNSAITDKIYVGSDTATINGDANLTAEGGSIGSIYGSYGNEKATGVVKGNLNIALDNVNVNKIYMAGKNYTRIEGDANLTISGNTNISGVIDAGGQLDGTTSATPTIDGTTTLNIGTASSEFIGSQIKVSGFQKINVVNGSVDILHFEQSEKGTSIAITKDNSLGLVADSADQFSKTSISNDGALAIRRGKLADGAEAAFKDYSGDGEIQAFGGTFADGKYTVGNKREFTGTDVKIGSDLVNDIQTVSFADKKKTLDLDFNVSQMGDKKLTISSIETVSDKGNIEGDFLGGFSVAVENPENANYSVVFSAYIGTVEDVSKLRIWHKSSGSDTWELFDESFIEYENGIATIMIDGFSAYAFSQVPEPAEYAAVFGAIAVAFALNRRRAKK